MIFANARTAAYATMLPNQDRCEVSLDLVTIAGTEHAMQANLTVPGCSRAGR